MLDLNSLVGVVFHLNHFDNFKYKLADIVASIESDDYSIIMGQYCQGPGEATAAIANAVEVADYDSFISLFKSTFKSIGNSSVECPKSLIVISDYYSKEADRNLSKIESLNEAFGYHIKLYPMEISDGECTDDKFPKFYFNDAEDAIAEIKRILKKNDNSRFSDAE